jgi:serine/threonine protein kinase
MALAPGTRLGAYEILSALGAGGMGEVYRARDTRLEREVAIKTLAAVIGDDPESRQRFQREARSIAALNHPHICTLHDVGQHQGIDYLVLEYLEGETVAARLAARGALTIHEALAITTGFIRAAVGAGRQEASTIVRHTVPSTASQLTGSPGAPYCSELSARARAAPDNEPIRPKLITNTRDGRTDGS